MLTLCSFLQSLFQVVKMVLSGGISGVVRWSEWMAGQSRRVHRQMTGRSTKAGRQVSGQSKRVCRRMEVTLAGALIVVLMTFTLNGFAGGGRSALTVYAETPQEEAAASESTEPGAGEAVMPTEAKVQVRFTDADNLREGQALAGSTLTENIRKQEAAREEIRAVVEKARDEIRKAEEQQAQALGETVPEESSRVTAAVPCSRQDYEVLKRIVEAEAGICDTKGRILVANVVLNRVRSGQFPNTITDVVYQTAQFSPVRDGRLNSCVVTPETVEAVNRALAGEDYSQGALYFMNRGRSRARNVSWFDKNLTYLFHHDQHEFFR